MCQEHNEIIERCKITYNPMQRIFFLSYKLRFLPYFHFYVSYHADLFTNAFLDVRRVFQISSMCIENDFSQFWSRLKWKSPEKNGKSHIFRDAPKLALKRFLSDKFTFSVIFSFLRVVWLWFFYRPIPWCL